MLMNGIRGLELSAIPYTMIPRVQMLSLKQIINILHRNIYFLGKTI